MNGINLSEVRFILVPQEWELEPSPRRLKHLSGLQILAGISNLAAFQGCFKGEVLE